MHCLCMDVQEIPDKVKRETHGEKEEKGERGDERNREREEENKKKEDIYNAAAPTILTKRVVR